MSRIRIEVLSGIAAASLLSVGVARADDHRLKPEAQRHMAQDGRGDTADFRERVVKPEQLGRVDRSEPVKPYTEKVNLPVALKAEVRAHFAENTENPGVPTKSEAAPAEDNRSQEQIEKDRARIMAQLPIKAEITLRVSDDRVGEGSTASAPSIEGQKKNASNRKGLDALGIPVKNEIKMRMHGDGDGQADEK